ncbi:MAG: DHH family phosphoesterase [Candidatus Riflebacteria bacterium]|nr:DHH family phosphoesterase [Candidatus Riflebacteria bacterium]
MELITTHNRTDFDALASVVAATFLYPGAVGVLPRLLQTNVQQFLAIHKDLFRLRPAAQVDRAAITRLVIVDTNQWKRLDRMDDLRERRDLEVHLWDHHMAGSDIEAAWECHEEVGATISLMVREMKARDCAFAPMQATLFLLGLYEDTGSLSFPSVKADDAHAAA